MKPDEALQYLAQVCNDYGRTLPPSAAMPFQQVAQDAINTLAAIVAPQPTMDAPPPDTPRLHAVPEQGA